MGFCVTIHASGVTWALGRIKRHPEYPRFWAGTWLFILVAAWIVMMHLVEIVVWAVFYFADGAMPALRGLTTDSSKEYFTLLISPCLRLFRSCLSFLASTGWTRLPEATRPRKWAQPTGL